MDNNQVVYYIYLQDSTIFFKILFAAASVVFAGLRVSKE